MKEKQDKTMGTSRQFLACVAWTVCDILRITFSKEFGFKKFHLEMKVDILTSPTSQRSHNLTKGILSYEFLKLVNVLTEMGSVPVQFTYATWIVCGILSITFSTEIGFKKFHLDMKVDILTSPTSPRSRNLTKGILSYEYLKLVHVLTKMVPALTNPLTRFKHFGPGFSPLLHSLAENMPKWKEKGL